MKEDGLNFIEKNFKPKERRIIRRYESLRRDLWRKQGTQSIKIKAQQVGHDFTLKKN